MAKVRVCDEDFAEDSRRAFREIHPVLRPAVRRLAECRSCGNVFDLDDLSADELCPECEAAVCDLEARGH